MKPMTRRELKSLMASEGLDPRVLDPLAGQAEDAGPWFVKLLMGMGAWIAGLLIALGLLVGSRGWGDRFPTAVLGILLCAGACAGRWAAREPFGIQLAMAVSVAGQAMAAVGFGSFAAMVGLEGALVVLHRDPVHRALSTGAAGAFLCCLLESAGLAWLGVPVLGGLLLGWGAIPPSAWPMGMIPFRRPVLLGLAGAFCGASLWSAFQGVSTPAHLDASLEATSWLFQRLAGNLLPGLLLGVAVLGVLRRLGVGLASPTGGAILLGWAGLTVAGLLVPGVPGMFLVLVLAMEAREPVLALLATLAGLLFLGYFYYDLETTLLAKSGILAASGGLLLLLRHRMIRKEARP
jgi:hypothetical protein